MPFRAFYYERFCFFSIIKSDVINLTIKRKFLNSENQFKLETSDVYIPDKTPATKSATNFIVGDKVTLTLVMYVGDEF